MIDTYHPPTLLIVDDEPEVTQSLVALLENDYQIKVASNGFQALEGARQAPFPDLILLDILLPGLGGLEVCRRLKNQSSTQNIPILFITSLNSSEDESLGLQCGASDYITKPISPDVVKARIKTHLTIYHHQRNLELQIRDRTAELRKSRLEIIRQLGRAAEYRDNETGYHVIRVGFYARLIALEAGMSEAEAELLFHAAPLHDLGKIGIPDHILLKPGPLDADEWVIMRKHSDIGAHIIGDTDSELLNLAKEIALTHHEHWNGKGYPKGLRGQDIPLAGRIIALVDTFDALLNERCYKRAWPIDETIKYIRKERGKRFDPELVNLLVKLLPDILDIASCYRDECLDKP